jgi:hypothetical protein
VRNEELIMTMNMKECEKKVSWPICKLIFLCWYGRAEVEHKSDGTKAPNTGASPEIAMNLIWTRSPVPQIGFKHYYTRNYIMLTHTTTRVAARQSFRISSCHQKRKVYRTTK